MPVMWMAWGKLENPAGDTAVWYTIRADEAVMLHCGERIGDD
ncbi:MAG: hypothetical protein ACLU48_02045 [Clostridiaceae bacterium]